MQPHIANQAKFLTQLYDCTTNSSHLIRAKAPPKLTNHIWRVQLHPHGRSLLTDMLSTIVPDLPKLRQAVGAACLAGIACSQYGTH